VFLFLGRTCITIFGASAMSAALSYQEWQGIRIPNADENSRLDLTAPTAYQGPRRLLKEGPIAKAKSGRKLTVVLCNDILVMIESKNLYRMVSGWLV
jgi:hypothetical protein